MTKSIIQSVKGTRDFYPEDFAFRNWLYGKVKKISEKYGYQEYDGPEIEYLELYAGKTSEEIIKEQVFSLKDRDGRLLALRPELTPTFARMVAQKAQELVKPIRWFMFGRAWRYEQPQKGRGREFFQWEINILGPERPEADAEILAIAAEYFKEVGLTPEEVTICVNDRSYFESVVDQAGIAKLLYLPLLRIIDKIEKTSEEEFTNALVNDLKLTGEQIRIITDEYIKNRDYKRSPWLTKVFESLKYYPGALDYIVFDPLIARGLDYYTRTVFEAWDKTGGLKRAIYGGGRFDNLTATIGGERIPGVGMAPGDMPIQALLEQFGKMPELTIKAAKVLVSVFNEELLTKSTDIASLLRANNINTELYLDENTKLDKQLKYADQKGIPYVVIIGPEEVQKNIVTVKNLKTREQQQISIDELIRLLQTK